LIKTQNHKAKLSKLIKKNSTTFKAADEKRSKKKNQKKPKTVSTRSIGTQAPICPCSKKN